MAAFRQTEAGWIEFIFLLEDPGEIQGIAEAGRLCDPLNGHATCLKQICGLVKSGFQDESVKRHAKFLLEKRIQVVRAQAHKLCQVVY